MSSVTSSFAQKSGRTKFLLCTAGVAAVSGTSPNFISTGPAFTLATTTVIPNSTVSQDQLNDLTATGIGASPASTTTTYLYRDLGREIVVFDDDVAGHPVTEVFREVTRVNGRDTEGISAAPAPMLFVKVFSSTGLNVTVARTG